MSHEQSRTGFYKGKIFNAPGVRRSSPKAKPFVHKSDDDAMREGAKTKQLRGPFPSIKAAESAAKARSKSFDRAPDRGGRATKSLSQVKKK